PRAPDLIIRRGPAAASDLPQTFDESLRSAVALVLLDCPAHQPGDDGALVLTLESLVEGFFHVIGNGEVHRGHASRPLLKISTTNIGNPRNLCKIPVY